jgi:glutamate/tyrosine decarboxylase-like PLP-dependent enzyme
LSRDVPLEAILASLSGPIAEYLTSLPSRAVWRDVSPEEIRQVLDRALPDAPTNAVDVVTDLAAELEPFVTAHASGRYFGFVIGGLHPAAYGAELLAASWDQNAGLFALAPGVMIAEEIAARWIVELLSLPEESSVGFVTGGQMANFTCLAAARDHVLRASGWDVEAEGLSGAPRLHVVAKTGVHATVPRALRYLGLGERTMIEVASDDQDRIVVTELDRVLHDLDGPTIVCVEAGNVNTGAFDDFEGVADALDAHRRRGHPSWGHVDGAVGLLAGAVPGYATTTAGLARLDSWSTDGHKLLNVAYDCGVAITRHSAAHRAAMSVHADYLVRDEDPVREALDWNPSSHAAHVAWACTRRCARSDAPASSRSSSGRPDSPGGSRSSSATVATPRSSTTWRSTRCWCTGHPRQDGARTRGTTRSSLGYSVTVRPSSAARPGAVSG